jgi:peroxiredoxin
LSKLSTWLTVARASAKIEKPNQQTGPKTTGVYAGAIAPDFRLTTLDGKELSLHAQRGKAVVINFWATWCGPCRSEMPALQKTAEEYAEQGMLLWGVDVGEPSDLVQSFVNELGLTFPLLLDRDSKVSRQYRVFGLPTTVFVKRDGVISDVAIGAMDKATLDKYVTRVMK